METVPELVRPAEPPRHRRKKAIVVVGTVLALVLAFLWYIGVIGGNVRVVEEGKLYRSAQLSGSNLEGVLRKYGIQSVVNLRGPSKKEFYRSEIQVCRDLGVRHFDVSLSAYRLPRPEEMIELLADLDRAPRPTLIHCQQGADRSGLVATIYQNVYEGIPLDKAEKDQLTWRYGHFAFVGTWRSDRFFDLYRETSRGRGLRAWIEDSYPKVYARQRVAQ